MHLCRVLIIVLSTLIATAAFGETYIIPVWASGLPSSDGTWWANAVAVNPSDVPVSYRVTAAFPLQTVPCSDCTEVSAPVTIAPGAMVQLTPDAALRGVRMVAGAFAIESSAPLAIHSVAYRPGRTELRQRLDVARRWIPAGRHAISTVERGSRDWRMNVFAVNPGDAAIVVSIWTGPRAENEIRTIVAPRSTAVIAVPPPRCNGVPCPFPADYPPSPITINVESTGELLTSASSLTSEWAVFSIADAARH